MSIVIAVYICPTEETSYGIDDRYQIRCAKHHKILLDCATKMEILAALSNSICHVVSGMQYLE